MIVLRSASTLLGTLSAIPPGVKAIDWKRCSAPCAFGASAWLKTQTKRLKTGNAKTLEDTFELAFNQDVSGDGFAMGLNLEQAAKVNTEGRSPKKSLDMV